MSNLKDGRDWKGRHTVAGKVTPSERVMTQESMFPADLEQIIQKTGYKPGWALSLEDGERRQGGRGLNLVILHRCQNTYNPAETFTVRREFAVPPLVYTRAAWCRWVLDCLMLVEQHEAMEWFQVAGDRIFAPEHGHGGNPYVVTDRASDSDFVCNYIWDDKPEPVQLTS